MATPTTNTTAQQMLAYLEQLRAQVAAAQQAGGQQQTHGAVSDDSDEEEVFLQRALAHGTLPLLHVTEREVTYSNGDTYKGEMLGDQRHGQGTHTTSTGDVYSGAWRSDVRHGQGTFRAASGMVYEGSWVDDKASGSGRCTYPDSAVYEGDWEGDERSGWGKLSAADGQSYEGEWEANAPHGEGQWVFADGVSFFRGTYKAGQRVEGQLVMYGSNGSNGSNSNTPQAGDSANAKQLVPVHTYTGRFKADQREGPDGVGVEEGLWVYRGDWRHDMRWGQGTCTFTDGSVYEGGYVRDMRHGSGRMTLSDGTTYEGQWQDDKLHGTGRAKYASGEVYVGQFQRGQRHGSGKWSSAPKAATATAASSSSSGGGKEVRETYVGQWVAGMREGHGVATYADGGRYEGEWRADKRHGQGLMVFADGLMFRGAWEDGEWLQSAAEPALCRMAGEGLRGAVAGQRAEFVIQARDELSNPRLNGGDTFQVLLVPALATAADTLLPGPSSLLTAPATPVSVSAGSDAAAGAGAPGGNTTTLASYPLRSSSGISTSSGGSNDSGVSSSSSSSGASVGFEAYIQQPTSGSASVATAAATPPPAATATHAFAPNAPTVTPPTAAAAAAGFSGPQAAAAAAVVVEAVAVGQVQDNGDGTYSCSYSSQVAGMYELHVTNGEGEHVGGSPCRVQVLPGPPSPRHSSVSGPGRSAATAGSRAEFTVTFRDAFGNACPCVVPSEVALAADAGETAGNGGKSAVEQVGPPPVEARLLGSNTLPAASVDVSAQADSSSSSAAGYSCSYVAPAAAGQYVLEVTMAAGGRHVGGSPFAVKVTPTTADGRTTQSLSAAATARAAASLTAAHTASSTQPSPFNNTAAGTPPLAAAAALTGSAAAAASSHSPGVEDKLRWWGDVAREAYAAIDGCLQGFEENSSAADNKTLSGDGVTAANSNMSGPEAEMVKTNPTLPVVERLEDLWLLSRLQQERKAKEQQQQQVLLQQEREKQEKAIGRQQLQQQGEQKQSTPPQAGPEQHSSSLTAAPDTQPDEASHAGMSQSTTAGPADCHIAATVTTDATAAAPTNQMVTAAKSSPDTAAAVGSSNGGGGRCAAGVAGETEQCSLQAASVSVSASWLYDLD